MFFRDKYRFLSNFYSSPIRVDDIKWATVEHYFQAQKAFYIGDREMIRLCTSPVLAKKLGQMIQCRSDWEQVKDSIMLKGLQAKFKLIRKLTAKLLETGDELIVEHNTWHDNYWGDCTCKQCEKIEGKNVLGKLIMVVRRELQNCLDI
jgi:ribA/ribD-fused uncharacterized protein